jgi:rhodanese-related sulfurtransferase
MKFLIIIISLLLLLVSGTYVCSERCCVYCSNNLEETQIIQRITVNNFSEGIINDDIILIDIRTIEEFNEGHIENAINMDYYANDFSNQINSLDKEKTYYIYCRSGTRSGNALNIFKNLGFKEVYDLKNGINSWKEEGFEVK